MDQDKDRECSLECAGSPQKSVCASDGRTFLSRCEFQRAKCKDPQLEIAYRGNCKGKHCRNILMTCIIILPKIKSSILFEVMLLRTRLGLSTRSTCAPGGTWESPRGYLWVGRKQGWRGGGQQHPSMGHTGATQPTGHGGGGSLHMVASAATQHRALPLLCIRPCTNPTPTTPCPAAR